MSLYLDLPKPLHDRLEAHAELLGLPVAEAAIRLLDKSLPNQKPAPSQTDMFNMPQVPKVAPPPPRERTAPPEAPSKGGAGGTWMLWADGACSGNPGPGGFGVVLEGPEGNEEWSKGFRNTTNNRMELRGAIEALERVPKGAQAVMHTDSRYVVDAIEKRWLDGWRKRGWRKSDGGEVKNVDLWVLLADAMAGKSVKFRWVEGHAGNVHNERCDRLAVAACKSDRLEQDRQG